MKAELTDSKPSGVDGWARATTAGAEAGAVKQEGGEEERGGRGSRGAGGLPLPPPPAVAGVEARVGVGRGAALPAGPGPVDDAGGEPCKDKRVRWGLYVKGVILPWRGVVILWGVWE